jgi:cytochrome bd-type quinol oxidase subunit 2
MLSAVWPIWDGNETWLFVTGVILWGACAAVYAAFAGLLSAAPGHAMPNLRPTPAYSHPD